MRWKIPLQPGFPFGCGVSLFSLSVLGKPIQILKGKIVFPGYFSVALQYNLKVKQKKKEDDEYNMVFHEGLKLFIKSIHGFGLKIWKAQYSDDSSSQIDL